MILTTTTDKRGITTRLPPGGRPEAGAADPASGTSCQGLVRGSCEKKAGTKECSCRESGLLEDALLGIVLTGATNCGSHPAGLERAQAGSAREACCPRRELRAQRINSTHSHRRFSRFACSGETLELNCCVIRNVWTI